MATDKGTQALTCLRARTLAWLDMSFAGGEAVVGDVGRLNVGPVGGFWAVVVRVIVAVVVVALGRALFALGWG